MELHARAIEVGGQHHRLAGADLGQLDLLEVGVDIGRADRDHAHQRGAHGDTLADLDLLAGDHPVDRRADHGAVQVELGAGEFGAGGGHLGVGLHRRPVDQGGIGGQGPRRGGPLGGGLGLAGPGGVERRAGGGETVLGGGEFVAGDGPRGRHGLAAAELHLGAVEIGLRAGCLGVGPADVGVAGGDLAAEGLFVGEIAAHLALGLAELGLGAGHRDAGVGIVQHHQHLAGPDLLGLVDRNLGHGRGHLGRHDRGLGPDIGVVGGHARPAQQQPIAGPAHGPDGHDGAQDGELTAAALGRIGDLDGAAQALDEVGMAGRGSGAGVIYDGFGMGKIEGHGDRSWEMGSGGQAAAKPPPSALTSWTSRATARASRSATVRRLCSKASSTSSTDW